MATLEGQVALVTGGGSGIGAAIALALAAAKARILLVGRTRQTLQEIVKQAGHLGSHAGYFLADLGDEAELRALIGRLGHDLPRLDILVQNAGVHLSGTVARAPLANLDQQYRVNLRAPYALVQALLPLLEASQGQVVFVNSSTGLGAKPGTGQYASTKHGLKALADSLRAEVNPSGIRVLSVYLGRTASPLQRKIHIEENKTYCAERLLQPQDVASVVLNALCLPRTAEVTDVHIRPMIGPVRRDPN